VAPAPALRPPVLAADWSSRSSMESGQAQPLQPQCRPRFSSGLRNGTLPRCPARGGSPHSQLVERPLLLRLARPSTQFVRQGPKLRQLAVALSLRIRSEQLFFCARSFKRVSLLRQQVLAFGCSAGLGSLFPPPALFCGCGVVPGERASWAQGTTANTKSLK